MQIIAQLITFLLLFSTTAVLSSPASNGRRFLARQASTPRADLGPSTNAVRMARGLPPKAPRSLYSPTRAATAVKRQASGSAPCRCPPDKNGGAGTITRNSATTFTCTYPDGGCSYDAQTGQLRNTAQPNCPASSALQCN